MSTSEDKEPRRLGTGWMIGLSTVVLFGLVGTTLWSPLSLEDIRAAWWFVMGGLVLLWWGYVLAKVDRS